MAESRLVLTSLSESQSIATITLNRPEKRNALSRALLGELTDAIVTARDRKEVRCIVLAGAGPSFCSGRDLADMREANRGSAQRERTWGRHEGSAMGIVKLLRDAPQITIAKVQGYCLGGGLVLVNACDLAVAADDAKLGMPEIIRGSYGSSATPTLFHSRLPLKTAFYISLTGRNLSGVEAARVGLVSRSAPSDELDAVVGALAEEIASRNPAALEHAKIAAYTQIDLPFDLAVKADDAIAHRMRAYTNPLSDVDGYLKSQKGGTNLVYRLPNDDEDSPKDSAG
jgi:enoyl-CoA hydratase/carnithine racemase